MGEWLDLFEGLGWFAFGVIALLVVIFTTRVRRIPLQRPGRTVLPRAAVPAEDRALLDTYASRLAALGFELDFTVVTRLAVAVPGKDRRFTDFYFHPEHGTLASAERPDTPEYGEPLGVTFTNAYVDGRFEFTVNRYKHNVLPLAPAWRIHDDYLERFEDAFAAHLKRVAAIRTPPEVDRAVLRQRVLENPAVFFKYWIETGVLQATRDPERWRISWLAAVKLVVRALAGSGRAARARPKAPPQSAPAPGDSKALEQQYALEKTINWSKGDKNWLTLISIAAFALLGSWIWGWTFMLVLLAVIGFHEMGHFLAMKLVGYRNLHVFFVPGLGGVATGTKTDATPMQKVFVYLAGPVPGLVVAVAVVVLFGEGSGGDTPPWAIQLVLAAIVINFLNLLPVTPLDGGRIAEVLVFAKLPLLRFLFAAACAVALFGGGFYLGDWVLRMLGLFFALSLPHQWRLYRLESALPPRSGALTEEQAKATVFQAASSPRFAGWSFPNRSAAAVALVDELQSRKPRWLEVAGGLAIYVACLVLPVVAMLELTMYGDVARMVMGAGSERPRELPEGPVEPMRDWKAEIAAASGKPEHIDVLLAANKAGYFGEPEDPPEALPEKLWALGQALPVGDPRRARTLLAGARVDNDPTSQARMRQAEEELSSLQGEDRVLLAELLEFKGWQAQTPQAAADAFGRALEIRESLANHGDDEAGLSARGALATNLYRTGNRTEAGRLLQVSVERSRTIRGIEVGSAERDYAGYLIAEGRGTEAETFLVAAVASLQARSGTPVERTLLEEALSRRLLWAQLTQATPEAAQRARLTIDAIESIKGYGAVKRPWKRIPPHQLDRLSVAQASGDKKLGDSASDALRAIFEKRPPGTRPCGQYERAALEATPWERVRLEAHGRNMRQLGLCPAAAA